MPRPTKRYLDKNDLRTLEEGFRRYRSPAELQKADNLLRELGYVKKSETPKRPGPKSKSSVNQTDETLRRLVATVRAVLDLEDDVPKMTVLTVLSDVLAEADRLLRRRYFVTLIESQQLAAICERAKQSEYAIDRRAHELVRVCLDNLKTPKAEWNRTLRKLAADQFQLVENDSGEQAEREIFSKLNATLELRTTVLVRCWTNRSGPAMAELGSPELEPKDLAISRRETLITAIGRLFHLTTLFSQASFFLPEQVSNELQGFCQENEEVIVFAPKETKLVAGELLDLIWTIGHRQGVHHGHLRPADTIPDPRPLEEGQIPTKW